MRAGFLFNEIPYLARTPKNEIMATDFDEKRRKAHASRRSFMDYGMGIVIAGFGVFFAISDQLGIEFKNVDPTVRYLFAGLCLLYGAFRIYRGYKKNYFNE